MSDRENSGWAAVRMGDLLAHRKERAQQTEPLLSVTGGRGVVPQAESGRRDVSSANKWAYWRVYPGDIVYNTMRMWQGVSARSDYFGIVSPAYTVCSPQSGVDSHFLSHVLKLPSFISAFKNRSQGLVSDTWNLKYRSFASIPVTVPGIAEQQRIGAILDAQDEAIRSMGRLIAKLEQAKLGLLQELFSDGAPTGHGLTQEEWQFKPAENFCERIMVGVVTGATSFYATSGVPFIRSQNVRPNGINSDDMLYITGQFNRRQSKSILQAGDVVVVRTGYPGTAAVVPPELNGANCFSLVICRPKPVLDPHFLACYMNSPVGKALIARTHFGSAQHNFNVAEMRRLLIPVPPLSEHR